MSLDGKFKDLLNNLAIRNIVRNTLVTIILIAVLWIFLRPCEDSSLAKSNNRMYKARNYKTAEALALLEEISNDFVEVLTDANPTYGLILKKRLTSTSFIEIDEDGVWAWNDSKGKVLAFRFYKSKNTLELELPDEQICSLLHELAHSVAMEWGHDAEFQTINCYFQVLKYPDGTSVKQHYIDLLMNLELYAGAQRNPPGVNCHAECHTN